MPGICIIAICLGAYLSPQILDDFMSSTAKPSVVGEPTFPIAGASNISLISVMAFAPGFISLIGVVGLLVVKTDTVALTATGAVEQDSEKFTAALEIYFPLIRRTFGTPRAIKRFLNRFGYLAMLNRADESGEDESPRLLLPEDILVALIILNDCLTIDLIRKIEEVNFDIVRLRTVLADPNEGFDPLYNDAVEAMSSHRGKIGNWPPSRDHVAAFRQISGGVRVAIICKLMVA